MKTQNDEDKEPMHEREAAVSLATRNILGTHGYLQHSQTGKDKE